MASTSIFKKLQFWLIVVGILFIVLAVGLYLWTEINQLLLILLGAVGLLLLIGATIWITVKNKREEPSFLKETGELVDRKIKVVVPAIGKKAEDATVKVMQEGGIKILKTSSWLNNGLTYTLEKVGAIKAKVTKIVLVVIIGVLLSEVGIGEGLIAAEVGSLVGSVAGPTAGTAVGGVAGSLVGSVAGGGSTALGSAASTGLTSLGSTLGSSAISSAGSALGSTAGQAGFAIGQGLVKAAGTEGVNALSDYTKKKGEEKKKDEKMFNDFTKNIKPPQT